MESPWNSPSLSLTPLAESLRASLLSSSSSLSRREIACCSEALADELLSNCVPSSVCVGLARDSLVEALGIFEAYGDGRACARVSNKIGICELREGRLGEAVKYFIRQSEGSEKVKRWGGVCAGLANAGVIYLRMGEGTKAREIIERGCEVARSWEEGGLNWKKGQVGKTAEKRNERERVAAFVNFLRGVLEVAVGEYKLAIVFHNVDLEKSTNIGDRGGILRAFTNLGLCHFKRKEYDKAEAYWVKGWEVVEENREMMKNGTSTTTNEDSTVDDGQQLATDGGGGFTPYSEARTLYHLGCVYVLGDDGVVDTEKGLDYLSRGEKICNESVATQISSLVAAREHKLQKQEEALKEEVEDGTPVPPELMDEIPEIDEKAVMAFGTDEGKVLHSQILHLEALTHLRLTTPNSDGFGSIPTPNIEPALDQIQKSIEMCDQKLVQSAVATTAGVISIVKGDWERGRNFHKRGGKLVEGGGGFLMSGKKDMDKEKKKEDSENGGQSNSSKSLAGLMGTSKAKNKLLKKMSKKKKVGLEVPGVDGDGDCGTEEKESDLILPLSTHLPGNVMGSILPLQQRSLRSSSVRNLALSSSHGSGFGLANSSGLSGETVTQANLRAIADMHKKEAETCKRNGDSRGEARAHGLWGNAILSLGGRKQDSFEHLDFMMKYAIRAGDLRMELQAIRSIADLQESHGESKNCMKTLRRYLKLCDKITEEAQDLVLRMDCVKRMITVYSLMSKEIKEIDKEMDKDEYDLLTDAELDEMENEDPQFLRANSKRRAMRFVDQLRKIECYHWKFRDDGSQMFDADIDAEEERYLKKEADTPKDNSGSGNKKSQGAMSGEFGGGGVKKKFGGGGGAFGLF